MREQDWIAWHKGQEEGDGKQLKAISPEAAAKKAVDIWLHEQIVRLGDRKVTVYLRDEAGKVHEVTVSHEGGQDAPEAFA